MFPTISGDFVHLADPNNLKLEKERQDENKELQAQLKASQNEVKRLNNAAAWKNAELEMKRRNDTTLRDQNTVLTTEIVGLRDEVERLLRADCSEVLKGS